MALVELNVGNRLARFREDQGGCPARNSGSSVALVGGGPTAIYTLSALIEAATVGLAVTIYEAQPRAGLGTPYRPGWNDPAMLSNIASIEIPPIVEKLIDWLRRQPRARLIRLGIDPEAIDDRTFYPRLALGEYFLDQLDALIDRARAVGISVEIAANCRVLDISAQDGGMSLSIEPNLGRPSQRIFDQVVLATGHCWPEEPEVRPGYFLSPWPATALHRIPASLVGVRGSSLTAIDAAVAIAVSHGTFIETTDGAVEYCTKPGDDDLKIVMMSRKGLLPEADFYHRVPYEPLAICTPEAMEQLIATNCHDLLERAYELFKRELGDADPDYAAHVGLDDLPLEDLADQYFADRAKADPFEWAVTNLFEARANYASNTTVPWRYAILRMHEVLALIVPHLSDEALERFNRFLKPVFVDEYATVPHLSIERMLALHRAGRLEVMAIGTDHRIDAHSPASGADVIVKGERHHFPFFVDATGQRALTIDAFPFPTLVEQGVVRTEAESEKGGAKGVAVDELFHPASDHIAAKRLFCLSIPFILSRHPFVQGITSSHEMGKVVGGALACQVASM